MLPHLTDQYIEGAVYRVEKHQRQDILASKAALHQAKQVEKTERRKSFFRFFHRRTNLGGFMGNLSFERKRLNHCLADSRPVPL